MSLDIERSSDAVLLSESSRLKSWWQDDLFLSTSNRQQQQQKRIKNLLIALVVFAVVALLLSVAALGTASSAHYKALHASEPSNAVVRPPNWPNIEKLAFGSCTSYDLRPQPIWTQGIIPAAPDTWVWLGDMTYMDDPLVDCNQVPGSPECSCTADYMRRPPFQCFAGDPVHARKRMLHQLSVQEYRTFLSYMCPGHQNTGVFPPIGIDPVMCPRPIFGVYDDHDSGWNNGNGRNPAKHEIKNIYLDGIGEPGNSPRRSNTYGLQATYILPGPGTSSVAAVNRGGDAHTAEGNEPGKNLVDEVQLVLLDERYFRETLPCSVKQAWCQDVLKNQTAPGNQKPTTGDVAYCQDFLVDGGLGQRGSCCKKDDEWDVWCQKPGSKRSLHWIELCDPTSVSFGQSQLLLDTDNTTVLRMSSSLWVSRQSQLSARLLEATTSPVCEVLGLQQRQWLQRQLQDSNAALKVIASGSVLAGSMGWHDAYGSECSGDDLLCWRRAQVNLLHTVANASGCVVVMTGDFHYSDMKIIQPHAGVGYAQQLQTAQLQKPVHQVMASGMTHSTAEHQGAQHTCEGTFKEDLVGLRPLGKCSYVPDPAFGMITVDWKTRVVSLSIRNHTTGEVAYGHDGSRQLLQFSLNSCNLLE